MNTLDNPMAPNESDISYKDTVVRYGMIGAGIAIVSSLITNLVGVDSANTAISSSLGCLSFVLYIVLQVLGIKNHRDKELGGYISFGRAFVVGFLISLLTVLISGLFNFIYLTFIDPNMMQTVIDATRDSYEEAGMDDEQIEQILGYIKMMYQPVNLMALTVIGGALFSAIISLIVSAIMKKDAPF